MSDRHEGCGQPVAVVVVLEDVVELLEFEVVEVILGEAVEDAMELLEAVDEVTEVMAELVMEMVEEVPDLLVAVIP